jgi:flagellar hook-length control protein FliK
MPAAHPAPTSPTSPATPTTATAHEIPQPTLSAAMGQLKSRPDGSYQLTVSLHPADLGAVQVHATLTHGTLDVTVACADDSARQAVAAALPDLRHQLAGAGSIELHLGQQPQHGPPSQHGHQSAPGDASPDQSGRRDTAPAPHRDPTDLPTDGGARRRSPHRPSSSTALDRWM